jgi:hypothetical protein
MKTILMICVAMLLLFLVVVDPIPQRSSFALSLAVWVWLFCTTEQERPGVADLVGSLLMFQMALLVVFFPLYSANDVVWVVLNVSILIPAGLLGFDFLVKKGNKNA